MENLLAARLQMAVSLGFHMVFAALGIGLPLLMLVAEGLWLRRGRQVYLDLDSGNSVQMRFCSWNRRHRARRRAALRCGHHVDRPQSPYLRP